MTNEINTLRAETFARETFANGNFCRNLAFTVMTVNRAKELSRT